MDIQLNKKSFRFILLSTLFFLVIPLTLLVNFFKTNTAKPKALQDNKKQDTNYSLW